MLLTVLLKSALISLALRDPRIEVGGQLSVCSAVAALSLTYVDVNATLIYCVL
jgi:hypothetical protein